MFERLHSKYGSPSDSEPARVLIEGSSNHSRVEAAIEDDTPKTDSQLTDRELIEAAQDGDSGAWRILYTRWLPWVWRHAYTQVKNIHGAEDVTSEAMMAWVEHSSETSRDAAQLAGWLRQVVHNKAVDYHRNAERSRRVIDRVSLHQQDAERERGRSAEAGDPLFALQEALARLDETQRLVLEWKYMDGLSVRQIAQRLGVTEKAAEARLYRAREEARQHYLRFQTGSHYTSGGKAGMNGQSSPPRSGSTV